MILITGAAGKTGMHIIRALRDGGQTVRAFVRTPAQREKVKAAGAAEILIGDLEAADDLVKAVQGIRAVYHICPNMHPGEVRIGAQLIDVCLDNRVEKFVYHSVFHPQIEAMPHHWNKLRVEEILVGSGLDYTIFQPTAYMQNVLARIDEVREEGLYRIPYNIETRISMVDLLDVAACAARALTGADLIGGTFELVGPDFLSQVEIASAMSEALGQPVQAEEIPLERWRDQAQQAGLAEYAVETLYQMFAYYDKFNFMGNQKALESILGRPPTSFEDFLQRELIR